MTISIDLEQDVPQKAGLVTSCAPIWNAQHVKEKESVLRLSLNR